ncbi:hypothetical protein Glove_78g45 [Diversispora epigaea]|uniref:NYN domain-containing protein n=1 Tax=Diversispora epigaea TaxID=1348612 RepID=A0A397JJJ4_9GLOM|nr:hypothetical protein Glove_78g45 [Diversispora epigaea]
MANTVIPISQVTSSRASSSKESSSSLGDFTPLWTYLENGTQDLSNLGDFGDLWRFLQGEKEKWCNAGTTPLMDFGSILASSNNVQSSSSSSSSTTVRNFTSSSSSSTTTTTEFNNSKQPPLLPHSSSSEYSSEEDADRKAIIFRPEKQVEGYVVVTVDKDTEKVVATTKKNNNKKNKKNAKLNQQQQESKRNKTTDGNNNNNNNKTDQNKTRNDDQNKNNNNNQEPKGLKEPATLEERINAKTTFKFRVPIPIKISEDPIHVFVDNSNILAGFLAYRRQQLNLRRTQTQNPRTILGKRSNNKPMLEYEALFTILERGRNVARRVLVASSPLYQQLDKAEEAGYEVSVLKRVRRNSFDNNNNNSNAAAQQQSESSISTTTITTSNTSATTNNTSSSSSSSSNAGTGGHQASTQFEMEKEQCVDELLHLKILESLLDYKAPATLVLASGDGKDAEYFQGGFHKCIIKALERGWKVEVISWQRQLSANFLRKKFLSKWTGLYHVVFLDWFAKELGCDI